MYSSLLALPLSTHDVQKKEGCFGFAESALAIQIDVSNSNSRRATRLSRPLNQVVESQCTIFRCDKKLNYVK